MKPLNPNNEGRKLVKEQGYTGWHYTDAVLSQDCPKCGSKKGFHCVTPKGRKAWPPHTERTILYLRDPETIERYDKAQKHHNSLG